MAITAAFVVSASVITERSGPVIGALVATLPISAGPSYVFLALDHDAAFIAEGALASLPINAATIILGLTYVVLAQRQNALVSCLGAVAVWIALASIIRSVQWTLAGGLIANAIAFAICVPLLRRFRHVRMPLITRRWYDIPLRAALVATLVATVVTSSGWVGPKISGIIALFPVVFTSMMLILHPRIGGPPTAAVIANSAGGLMGLGIAIAMINVASLRFGSAIGFSVALAICVSWNLGLWWWGRRKLVRRSATHCQTLMVRSASSANQESPAAAILRDAARRRAAPQDEVGECFGSSPSTLHEWFRPDERRGSAASPDVSALCHKFGSYRCRQTR